MSDHTPEPNETALTPPLDGALHHLRVAAPPDAFLRFRRRASLAQGARTLVESQVMGFWVVLDAFLRLLLGSHGHAKKAAATEERV